MLDTASQAPMPQISVPNSSFFFTGQLISKCPFGVKTSSKKPTKLKEILTPYSVMVDVMTCIAQEENGIH